MAQANWVWAPGNFLCFSLEFALNIGAAQPRDPYRIGNRPFLFLVSENNEMDLPFGSNSRRPIKHDKLRATQSQTGNYHVQLFSRRKMNRRLFNCTWRNSELHSILLDQYEVEISP